MVCSSCCIWYISTDTRYTELIITFVGYVYEEEGEWTVGSDQVPDFYRHVPFTKVLKLKVLGYFKSLFFNLPLSLTGDYRSKNKVVHSCYFSLDEDDKW